MNSRNRQEFVIGGWLPGERGNDGMLDEFTIDESPFVGAQPDEPGATFVQPRIVREVEFTEWTQTAPCAGPRMRAPATNRTAHDVVREASI
ncbi:MAG TPA: hypothetical protein VFQ15_08360 [Jiangellaceae bacterium]|nr:hypothetical protein [Jiangellaceae bacterium]